MTELSDVGRVPSLRGLVLASGGNLSAGLPGADEFVVTGTGSYLDRLTPGGYSVVGLDGTLRPGNERSSSEWKLHQRTYRARPDANAVIHLRPQHTVLLDALGFPVRLISLGQAYYVRKVVRVPYFPSGSDEHADAVADAAHECNAVIMGFHGCSCLGETIAMGFRRAQNLEQAAMMTSRCTQLGNTDLTFPPEWMDKLATI
jgi:L-fuculose-phosphate aldolase